jgi:molybdate transport system substrate-binding protein
MMKLGKNVKEQKIMQNERVRRITGRALARQFFNGGASLTLQFLLLVAVGLLLAGGCGKKEAEEQSKDLLMLCGEEFVPPGQELCSEFEAETGIEIESTIADSVDFLPHIKLHDEGDIVITHDPYLDYTRKAGSLGENVNVGFLVPVLVVQKGNPKGIKSLEDLTRPGLKVGLTDPKYSECGEIVAAVLKKKGIKDAVMKNVENRLVKGHSKLATLLKAKAIDAAIMWNGTAHTFSDSLDIVKTPNEFGKETHIHIMSMSYSKHPEEVKKFMDFVRKRGPEVFAQYGYEE